MNAVFYSNLSLVQNSLLTTKRRVGIEEGGREADGWRVSDGGQGKPRQSEEAGS